MKLSESLVELGPCVTYYPKMARVFGLNESIILCQLIYWTGKESSNDGWIFKTQDDLLKETGLTPKQQRTAIESLVSEGMIEERYERTSHKKYYKVCMDYLDDFWNGLNRDFNKCHSDTGAPAERASGTCPNGVNHLPKGQMPPAQMAFRSTISTEITTESTQRDVVLKEFPQSMRTQRLICAWERWMNHRRAFKKPKSWVNLFNDQIDYLAELGEERAFQTLRHSLVQGYMGLWEARPANPVQQKPAVKDWRDRILDNVAKELEGD